MSVIPEFDIPVLERLCEVLADTSTGLTGSEIGKLLGQLGVDDPLPGMTKRVRLFEALTQRQQRDRCGNLVVAFKAQEQVAFAPEPEPQGSAMGQIGTHAATHRRLHGLVRGQGRAAWRSCSKCTLAYGAVVSTERWPKTSAISLRSVPR